MSARTELQERFDEEVRLLLRERNSIAFVVAAFLFPAFCFEDILLMPERWRDVLVLRLTCALVCILCMAVNKSAFGERSPFLVTLTGAAFLNLLQTFICPFDIRGIAMLYFTGHILITVGALSLLPLSTKQAIAVGFTSHLSYLLPTVVLSQELDPLVFPVQNGYLLCTWGLLSMGCWLNSRMRYREFDLRSRLYRVRQRVQDYG